MSNEVDLKDIVRQYITDDIALYSLWMPGDISTSLISVTKPEFLQTFDCIIEIDDVALACVGYLISTGVPVFKTTRLQTAYTAELEEQLRRGLSPADAQRAALAKTRPPGDATAPAAC